MSVVGNFFLDGKKIKIVFKNDENVYLRVYIEFESLRGVFKRFCEKLQELEEEKGIEVYPIETPSFDVIIITSKSLCDFKNLSADSLTAETTAINAFRQLMDGLRGFRIDEGTLEKFNSI